MSDHEPPLTPEERLLLVSLYAHLSQSQNCSVSGQLGSERACYADHDIRGLKTLSHKKIPATSAREGFETC